MQPNKNATNLCNVTGWLSTHIIADLWRARAALLVPCWELPRQTAQATARKYDFLTCQDKWFFTLLPFVEYPQPPSAPYPRRK